MRQTGFTLLEVLISMTLLGLIMVLLYQTMNLGVKSWDSGEQSAVQVAEMRDAYGFIKKQVNRMLPILGEQAETLDERKFLGQRELLRFVANLPDNIGISGPVIHEFVVEDVQDRVQLRLKLTMDHPDSEWKLTQGEDDEEGYVLISGAKEIRFSYFGAKNLGDSADWFVRWETGDSLPSLVKVEVEFADDHAVWPELLAKVMVGNAQGVLPGQGGAASRGRDNDESAEP